MKDHLVIEEEFKTLLPVIENFFPEGRNDFSHLNELIRSFRQMSFYENDIIGLIDHKRHRPICLSDNFEEITGISREKVFKWKSRYMLQLLDKAHFSYAYRALTEGMKFFYTIPKEERLTCKRFTCGMKFKDAKGNTRRGFIKTKALVVDANQDLDVSIFFIKDVSHLVKGEGYWMRHTAPSKTTCFVKQKGKQRFDDLLTNREIEIVELLAQHKTSSEIADQLFLSRATVEKHRKNMIKRTGAANATALVHLCKLAEVVK